MKHHRYGEASKKKIQTLAPLLARVTADALILCPYDITIVHGWRSEEMQNALFDRNASQKRWPDSLHNKLGSNGTPQSQAVDFAPWVNGSIPWDDTHIFAVVAGSFFAAANEIGVKLRWGGDWDGDGLSKGDQKFFDYGHIELAK